MPLCVRADQQPESGDVLPSSRGAVCPCWDARVLCPAQRGSIVEGLGGQGTPARQVAPLRPLLFILLDGSRSYPRAGGFSSTPGGQRQHPGDSRMRPCSPRPPPRPHRRDRDAGGRGRWRTIAGDGRCYGNCWVRESMKQSVKPLIILMSCENCVMWRGREGRQLPLPPAPRTPAPLTTQLPPCHSPAAPMQKGRGWILHLPPSPTCGPGSAQPGAAPVLASLCSTPGPWWRGCKAISSCQAGWRASESIALLLQTVARGQCPGPGPMGWTAGGKRRCWGGAEG